jgi:hypothetical protein
MLSQEFQSHVGKSKQLTENEGLFPIESGSTADTHNR